jgi:predicted dehydrogenase
MTDWGVHLLDYALLGMNATSPLSVSALGGKFAKPDSADETPDTLMALYDFGKFNLVWDHAIGIGNGNYNRDHGIAFIGNNGTLVLNRGGWEVLEEKKNSNKVLVPFNKSSDNGLDLHWQNFITAIRENTPSILNCPMPAASAIANLAQLGNIAFRTGKKLEWKGNKFTDEAINKKYLLSEYHNGYKLPNV